MALGPLGLIDLARPPLTLAEPLIAQAEEYLRVPSGLGADQPLTLTDEQVEVLWAWYSVTPNGRRYIFNRKLILRMAKGWAKALALDTPLPTPTGWTTMAEVAVGDVLIDETGAPTEVLAATPVMTDHDCYRVTFKDGTSIVADAGHLWPVNEFYNTRRRRPRVLPTADLVDVTFPRRLTTGKTKALTGGVARWTTLPTPPIESAAPVALPVPSYLLGYWLGDGDSDQPRITVHVDDLDSLTAAAIKCGWPLSAPALTGTNTVRVRFGSRGQAISALRELDVVQHKHIPPTYLRAALDDRWYLLRGLMDSDGHVGKNGQCAFTSTIRQLADDTCELIRTLGMYPRISEGIAKLNGRVIGPTWKVTFHGYNDHPPVTLPRKVARLRPRPARPFSSARTIVSVDKVPSVPVRCVSVSGPSSLYLAGTGMVPTHNSPIGAVITFNGLTGDVIPDGLDAYGNPVGRPHPRPWLQVAANALDQTDNLYKQFHDMLASSAAIDDFHLDLGVTRTTSRGGGLVEPVTSEAGTREGQPISGAALEETHLYRPSNGGVAMADTIGRNATKFNARTIELTNAYVPGAGSHAQRSEEAVAKGRGSGVLLVTREAAAPTDDEQMRDPVWVHAQLEYVYGSAATSRGGWVDLDRVTQDIVEAPDDRLSQQRRFFFNQVVAPEEHALDLVRWVQLANGDARLVQGDTIAIGFDGSDSSDSTALYACRWPDWTVFELQVWEPPFDELGRRLGSWRVPRLEVLAKIRNVCSTYRVIRGYADDAGWATEIDTLNGEVGQAFMRFPHRQDQRIGPACERWQTMIDESTLRHDGMPTLGRHAANARKVPLGRQDQPERDAPKWWRPARRVEGQPIDALSAAISAVHALGDAVAHGEHEPPKKADLRIW